MFTICIPLAVVIQMPFAIGPSGEKSSVDLKPDEELRDYVLSSFKISEEKQMKDLLARGMAACRTWVAEPLTKAMNQVNAGSL